MSTPFAARLRAAEAHLAAAAPPFAGLIAAVGPCTLAPEPDVFRVLVRAVLAQMISTAAARSITGRLDALVKGKLTPARVLALTEEQLRGCGISGGKARSLRELAAHFRGTRGFARQLADAEDATARELLLPLRGIGPWTVDMTLMFGLFRLDVLPVGDLGIRAGMRDMFGLKELPGPAVMHELSATWRPYRTVASWYLWRMRDTTSVK